MRLSLTLLTELRRRFGGPRRSPAAPRSNRRRARLEVEHLEAKVLPSAATVPWTAPGVAAPAHHDAVHTASAATTFDGKYTGTQTGQSTATYTPNGGNAYTTTTPLDGALQFEVRNGDVYVGNQKEGSVSASGHITISTHWDASIAGSGATTTSQLTYTGLITRSGTGYKASGQLQLSTQSTD